MSTSSSFTPMSAKAIIEKNRRELINGKIDELRDLFIDPSVARKISQGEVLNRAALLLNGQDANTPMPRALSTSSPGPIRCLKEIRKVREQGRRDLQTAGFNALKQFVVDKGLAPETHLDRPVLLDIVIEEVKKIMFGSSAAPVLVLPSPTATTSTDPEVIPEITPELLILWYNIMVQNQKDAKTDQQAAKTQQQFVHTDL